MKTKVFLCLCSILILLAGCTAKQIKVDQTTIASEFTKDKTSTPEEIPFLNLSFSEYLIEQKKAYEQLQKEKPKLTQIQYEKKWREYAKQYYGVRVRWIGKVQDVKITRVPVNLTATAKKYSVHLLMDKKYPIEVLFNITPENSAILENLNKGDYVKFEGIMPKAPSYKPLPYLDYAKNFWGPYLFSMEGISIEKTEKPTPPPETQENKPKTLVM